MSISSVNPYVTHPSVDITYAMLEEASTGTFLVIPQSAILETTNLLGDCAASLNDPSFTCVF